MSLFDLIMIGISLSMDAFAVSICKGLSVRQVQLSHALICGAWFGAFQAIMPSFGYFLGSRFEHLLNSVGPWVAFILLAVIGVNMVHLLRNGPLQSIVPILALFQNNPA